MLCALVSVCAVCPWLALGGAGEGGGEEGKRRKGGRSRGQEGRGRERRGESRYLAVLLQVVVEDLGVRLLMGGQNVHEGGRWVGRSCGRIDGAPTS